MITVRTVSKNYGSVRALDSISFEVREGEILGFLGPNGAGKTTTMKILTGYFPPTSGTVEIGGMSLAQHAREIKRLIGYLPESVPLYTDMRVRDFLSFVAQAKGLGRRERTRNIAQVIAECGLDDVTGRMIRTLSKGFRQRVGLGQALIGNPRILILDEPTIGLDPQQIIEIRQLIKKMAGTKTVILSSHILPEVSMVSDRVIIINNGVIAAIDTPANLQNRFSASQEIMMTIEGESAVVCELVRAVPHVMNVRVGGPVDRAMSYVVSAEKGYDVRAELTQAIVAHRSLRLLELKTVTLSLEDIFLKLVTTEETV